jgi:hypothetical protein
MSDHDLLPLYALDSLPDDERIAFDAHLGTCRICRRELATFAPVFDGLADDLEAEPPPELRERVLARIVDVPQEPVELPAMPDEAAPADLGARRARRIERAGAAGREPSAVRWLAAAAAILVFALIAASMTGVALWRRTTQLEEQVTRLEQTVGQADQLAAVLSADDAVLVDVQTDLSGDLRVAVADSVDAGVVVADDLEAPPDDRVYQLWLVEDEQPRSVGLIAQTSGVLGLLTDLGGAQAVAISVEPPSGSETPTGPIVAQAALN